MLLLLWLALIRLLPRHILLLRIIAGLRVILCIVLLLLRIVVLPLLLVLGLLLCSQRGGFLLLLLLGLLCLFVGWFLSCRLHIPVLLLLLLVILCVIIFVGIVVLLGILLVILIVVVGLLAFLPRRTIILRPSRVLLSTTQFFLGLSLLRVGGTALGGVSGVGGGGGGGASCLRILVRIYILPPRLLTIVRSSSSPILPITLVLRGASFKSLLQGAGTPFCERLPTRAPIV